MNKPQWDEKGDPANIEAAAIDVLEWVRYLKNAAPKRVMFPENNRRVTAAIVALYRFIDTSKDATGNEP